MDFQLELFHTLMCLSRVLGPHLEDRGLETRAADGVQILEDLLEDQGGVVGEKSMFSSGHTALLR